MLFGLLSPNYWFFLVLMIMIQFLCLREYLKLTALIYPELQRPKDIELVTQIAGLVIMVSYIFLTNPHYRLLDTYQYEQSKDVLISDLDALDRLPLLSPYILTGFLILFAFGLRNHLGAGLEVIGGLVYVSVPILLLIMCYQINSYLPVTIIALIWINDTMAYIVGSFIGRTPFSKISPKKTWEGTGGGVLLTIGCAIAAEYVLKSRFGVQLWPLSTWIAFAVIVGVFGTMGDLFESKLKRMAGVKDSGSIMPGHGGALDRFDSLLGTLPIVYFYCEIFF